MTVASSPNGSVVGTAGRVLTTLPAQFLALVLVNTVFLVSVLWFVEKQQEIASRVAVDVFKSCITGALTVPGPQKPKTE